MGRFEKPTEVFNRMNNGRATNKVGVSVSKRRRCDCGDGLISRCNQVAARRASIPAGTPPRWGETEAEIREMAFLIKSISVVVASVGGGLIK